MINTNLAAKQAHLRRVVIKECSYLIYTAEKLNQIDPLQGNGQGSCPVTDTCYYQVAKLFLWRTEYANPSHI